MTCEFDGAVAGDFDRVFRGVGHVGSSVFYLFFVNVIFFGRKTENDVFRFVFLPLARRRRKFLLFYIILYRFPLIFESFGKIFSQPHQKNLHSARFSGS